MVHDPRTDEERAKRSARAVQMHAAGKSIRAIADELNVSRSTVQRDIATASAPVAVNRSTDHPARFSRRVTMADQQDPLMLFGSAMTVVQPPDALGDAWNKIDLSAETFEQLPPARIFDILRSASPDVSRAVWDYLRLLDPGHEITALHPGTEDPFPQAQAKLDEFIGNLADRYGSTKVLTGRLFMGALMRGAFFAELVLDETGRVPIDLVIPDAMSVRFRWVKDEETGEKRLQMCQWQGGELKSIERETVRYIPVDPAPGSPYGVAPIAPAVFPALFLIGLMGDVRRVIAQQGYPRTDIVLKLEAVREMVGQHATYKDLQKITEEILDSVAADYAYVGPEDAWFHTDATEIGQSAGAVSADGLRGIDAVIASLERMLVKALKTMPLMMGDAAGASEANANRQWEIYAAGIKSLQHLAESLLERLFTLALEAQGIRAKVAVRFAELRAAEELRDELTLQAKLSNAENMERLGFVDHDEASMHAVGHEATGTPKETGETAPGVDPNTPAGEQVERGKQRIVPVLRDKVEPEGDAESLGPLPATVTVDEADADRAIATWDAAMGEEWRGLLEAEVYDPDDDEDEDGDA